ncbi:probable phospholipid-transporting ATPase VA [Protobothrops mucrosquamatus]|uniref:probable phospholipid-transporting ATPase VA n=1 Tax=Protobothrops mucrosquamatus TaxID=103944 RepID=UPI0007758161|nr:probable phospholipid-transporting ATPase VA [Protobothrops mucrosquamatus]
MCSITFLRDILWFRRPCCQSVVSESESVESVTRRKGEKNEETKRVVLSNLPFEAKWKENPNRRHAGNKIKTTRYTFLSFIPKNIFEQFHRFANVYFVAIVVLNFVPVVNVFEPGISVLPVCVIMAITALKDAWEDFRRYKLDKEINSMCCLVYNRSQNSYIEKCWKDVQVGDFVQLQCNEVIPADILLLYSSDQNRICYLETANLDGETNLKQRRVVKGFSHQVSNFPLFPW